MRLILSCLFILGVAGANAQKHTISGFIKDSNSGESLIGATVVNTKTKSGSASNVHCFFSLTLPADSVHLIFSYVGYQPKAFRFLLRADTSITVSLISSTLEEVVISASKSDPVHEKNEMSTIIVPTDQIKAMPAFLGETDVLKVLQLLPGVQSGNEGSTGLYVRGGGPDQNLILLDGVPIYNAAHLFGFFSVFNADAINHVELVKGGFPARYGGRLSSVIDISMKDGNLKEVKGEGSIGIISAKATVEGPIKKDQTSFLISARRTYLDILAKPIIKATTENVNTGYYFYDVNFKVSHKLNKNNFIYASAYLGNDKAYAEYEETNTNPSYSTVYDDEFGLLWGNVITALRWKRVISPKLFANVSGTYSRYKFNVFSRTNTVSTPAQSDDGSTRDQYTSGINDLAIKLDFDWVPNPNHYVRFGANATNHKFSPGVYTYRAQDQQSDSTIGTFDMGANEFYLYGEDNIKLSTILSINLGSHLSAFRVDQQWYHSWQPRISTRLLLGKDWALKSSYARMTQYIHLLTNAGIGLPTDLWVPSTSNIDPQQSNQVALGVAKTHKRMYEFTVEGYYKTMSNLIEYKDGASYANIGEDWQNKVAKNGNGESYGIELLLQKKTGALTGWLGYTWSRTFRQFEEINNGNWFPYRYDRRHDISLTMSHTWNERMDFSMVWVFGTGNAITLPIATYESIEQGRQFYSTNNNSGVYYGYPIQLYESRNDYRMRSYHRLDLSFSFWKNKKWGQRKWTIGVYNAYNRMNPFFVEIGYARSSNPALPMQKKLIQYSLFPIIPSITYGFKF